MTIQLPSNLRAKIAQLISIRVGSNMPPLTTASEDYDAVASVIEEHQVGGLLLFNGGSADSCCDALQRLQQLVTVPMLVASDMERGSGQQVGDHALWPHCLAFDALGESAAEEVEKFAFWSSRQAMSLGVHANFSPVADIHRNPRNPIIATRAFGTTAERVIELTSAFVRGCQRAGMLTCGKHFPGHGNTVEDSHAALPVVRVSADELAATDLAPFRALAQAGVDMFMTAHVAYPALDPSCQPATLSRPIMTKLLREKMGFQGVVVSDSLKMEGVHVGQSKSEAELAVDAIAAGVDVLLDVSDVAGVIERIELQVDSDAEFAARFEQAFERAWEMKQRALSREGEAPAEPERESTVAPGSACASPSRLATNANQHALHVASQSLTVTHDAGEIVLPIADQQIYAVLINPYGDGAYTRTDVLRSAMESASAVTVFHVLTDTSAEAIQAALTSAKSADVCFVAVVVKPAAWRTFGMPSELHELVQQLTRLRPTIVASLGIQEILNEFNDAAVRVAMFSDVAVSQQALVEWLLGH